MNHKQIKLKRKNCLCTFSHIIKLLKGKDKGGVFKTSKGNGHITLQTAAIGF
jgi:hypothetical protein